MAALVLISYCIPRNTGLHGRGRLLIRGCEVVTMLLGTRKQESVKGSPRPEERDRRASLGAGVGLGEGSRFDD